MDNINSLNKSEIEIRKIITFNRVYLVVPKGSSEHMSSIMSVIESWKEENPNQKIIGFPDFIPEDFRLKSIAFGKVMVLMAVHKNDLFDLFANKKSSFLSSTKQKALDIDVKKILGKSYPEFIIINDENLNESNSTPSRLTYFNRIIDSKTHRDYGNLNLDYKKAKKVVEDYEKDCENSKRDYFLSGF